MKRRQGSKPLAAELLRALAPGGVWCRVGVVEARPEASERYELADGAIRVDVKLQGGEWVFARLGALAAGANVGIWSIPPAGAEVLVALPEGSVEGEAVVVAVLDTGAVPDGLDDSGVIVIAVKGGAKVLVHDGNAGDAKALATKDDVDNHTHLFKGQVVTTAAAGTWQVALSATNPGVATDKPDPITGTSVLKAK